MAMSPDFKERLGQAWHEAWDRGNVDAFDEFLAPDFTRVTHRTPEPLDAAGYKDFIREIRRAFPDLQTTIEAMVEDGDKLAIFWSSTGTHRDELDGIPPTNRHATMYGSDLCTIVDGQITHEIVTWDSTELRSFLGIATVTDQDLPGLSSPDPLTDVDPEMLKSFNRQFVTGVTVVTTMDGDTPRGLAVNAYCSVSLDPPLVMVCVQNSSTTWPALFRASHLGVNVLGCKQNDTVAVFATKDPDKFSKVDWTPGPHGSPLLTGSVAALEGEIHERFQAKTHTIFVCRVRHAEVADDAPMVYKAGQFFDGGALNPLPG